MLRPMTRVSKTGGNRAGLTGSRWNRSGPVHEPVFSFMGTGWFTVLLTLPATQCYIFLRINFVSYQ
jgi:hypothetical protein